MAQSLGLVCIVSQGFYRGGYCRGGQSCGQIYAQHPNLNLNVNFNVNFNVNLNVNSDRLFRSLPPYRGIRNRLVWSHGWRRGLIAVATTVAEKGQN